MWTEHCWNPAVFSFPNPLNPLLETKEHCRPRLKPCVGSWSFLDSFHSLFSPACCFICMESAAGRFMQVGGASASVYVYVWPAGCHCTLGPLCTAQVYNTSAHTLARLPLFLQYLLSVAAAAHGSTSPWSAHIKMLRALHGAWSPVRFSTQMKMSLMHVSQSSSDTQIIVMLCCWLILLFCHLWCVNDV